MLPRASGRVPNTGAEARCRKKNRGGPSRAMNKLLSEFIGTFALVFAGTGAIVINHASGGAITHPGIALTFGLIILAMIYTFGDVSGAHFNPAVTIAFAAARRFAWREVPGYVGAQILGALAASVLMRLLFPADSLLGATTPAGPPMQSFVLEVVLTFLLMLVILSVSTGAKEKGITAGIAIGAVIALEAMFAGPISGASMNPARSIGPALVSGHLGHLWVYIAAPFLGALLATPMCALIRGGGCCAATANTELINQ
jgi:aquaporin Z